jgi:signal peptidase I
MNNLNWVQTSDLHILTCGSDDLTYEENINIIKHVFNFIKSSKRFNRIPNGHNELLKRVVPTKFDIYVFI